MKQPRTERPPRTVGLTLAIAASVFIFTLTPLIQVGMVVIIQLRIQSNLSELALPVESGEVEAIATGGNLTGVSTGQIIAQTALALGFLIIAVLAWSRRVPRIRAIYSLTVIAYGVWTIGTSLAGILSAPQLTQGIDSGDALRRPLLFLQLALTSAILLYVLWYVNRAPARAFFRGYYLNPPAGPTRVNDP